jgi:hypothetical protein
MLLLMHDDVTWAQRGAEVDDEGDKAQRWRGDV